MFHQPQIHEKLRPLWEVWNHYKTTKLAFAVGSVEVENIYVYMYIYTANLCHDSDTVQPPWKLEAFSSISSPSVLNGATYLVVSPHPQVENRQRLPQLLCPMFSC